MLIADCENDHGGKFDVEKTHENKETHRITNSNTKVTSYLQQSSSADMNTINAEVLFIEFLIEHGLPLAVADHIGPLFKRMFPDSKIAEKYACARTKSSHIVRCLAEDTSLKIAEAMKIGPFSIVTDGSCDYDDKKLYPVCVRYFDSEKGKVMSVLLFERQSKSFKSVRFFVKRYPFLLPPLFNLDHLEEESLKYQVRILPDNLLNADRVDVQWHIISQLKDYH